jgi:hypothetical protein
MSSISEENMNKQLLADAKAMGLTARQIARAKREGVTTILGLRRIEKNGRSKANEKALARLIAKKP